MIFIHFFSRGREALEYESNGYVTGEQKQGAFGVGFLRKRVIGCRIPQNWVFVGVNFPKKESFGVNWVRSKKKIALFRRKLTKLKMRILHSNFEKRGSLGVDCSETRGH